MKRSPSRLTQTNLAFEGCGDHAPPAQPSAPLEHWSLDPLYNEDPCADAHDYLWLPERLRAVFRRHMFGQRPPDVERWRLATCRGWTWALDGSDTWKIGSAAELEEGLRRISPDERAHHHAVWHHVYPTYAIESCLEEHDRASWSEAVTEQAKCIWTHPEWDDLWPWWKWHVEIGGWRLPAYPFEMARDLYPDATYEVTGTSHATVRAVRVLWNGDTVAVISAFGMRRGYPPVT